MIAGRGHLQITIVGNWYFPHTQSVDSAGGEKGEQHLKTSMLDPVDHES
jgi:hypothetical protein